MREVNGTRDQADGLRKSLGGRPVKVIAVTGGKGGVGKTNVTANLGIALARRRQRVLLLDADLGLANLDVLMGLRARDNLSHVLDGTRSLDDIIVTGPAGVAVVPGASGLRRLLALERRQQVGLIHAFSELTRDIDVLLIDTAAGLGDSVLDFCRAAQRVMVVVCDEPPAITDAYALVKVLSREFGVRSFEVLANMTRGTGEGAALHEKLSRVADRFLDVHLSYAGEIPYDERLREAVRRQVAVTDAFPDSPVSLAFDGLARRIEAWTVPQHPSGHIEFFMERLLAASRAGGILQ
ncbi:MAG TPA: P-loop NTPase [Steroidobacteraceae bacterium]|nr:P-loop NTPase [Steroidobacteraceae bacterium]